MQDSERTYNIPAQPLGDALNAFARAADVQLAYSAELITGKTSGPLNGSFTVTEGITKLLAGTGLTFRAVDERTFSLEQLVESEGERVLGAVRVEGATGGTEGGTPRRGEGIASLGGVRGHQADEAKGYRPRVASVGSGAPVGVEDVPRSISVLTQAQIEAQDIADIGEALRRVPGVTVVENIANPGQRASVLSRGQSIERLQVDGGPPRTLDIIQNGLIDLGPYERVELLRGANGLFVGDGSPGGTLNLVRKRPGSDPSATLKGVVGSWNRFQLGYDYSTPSIAGSDIGFRGVVSWQKQNFFYETHERRNSLVYGIFDAPLGENGQVEFGLQYSKLHETGMQGGVPRFLDGPLIFSDRKLNLTPPWAFQDVEQFEVFSRLNAELAPDWEVQSQFQYSRTSQESIHIGTQVGLLSTTGRRPIGLENEDYFSFKNTLFNRGSSNEVGVDIKLNGRFSTFFLDHALYIGADYYHTFASSRESISNVDQHERQIHSVADLSPGGTPEPTDGYVQFKRYPARSSQQRFGLTLADTISLGKWLDLNLAVRRYSSRTSLGNTADGDSGEVPGPIYTSDTITDAKWRPSYSAVFKPFDGARLFVSHAEGSESQAMLYDEDGKPLDPSIYRNLEAGVKYGTSNWTASAVYYKSEQTNVAEPIFGNQTCPPTGVSLCYSVGGATTRTQGFDIEVAGEIIPGLAVSASFNRNKNRYISERRPLSTQSPSNQLRLLLDWTPSWHPKLTARLSALHQSKNYQTGSTTFFDPTDGHFLYSIEYDFTEPAYTIFDIGFDYRLSDRFKASLLVENLTDETYLSTVSAYNNFYGKPRSVTLALSVKDWPFRPKAIQRHDALFGNGSDWYGAIDLGYHDVRSVNSRSKGVNADGAHINWHWRVKPDAAAFVRFGYKISDHWRAELEGSYRPGHLGSVSGDGAAPTGICSLGQNDEPIPTACVSPNGRLDMFAVMGNIIYDIFPEDAPIRPAVGVGIGTSLSSVSVNGRLADMPSLSDEFRDVAITGQDRSFNLAWQAIAGASFRLSRRTHIDLTYRYLSAYNLEWDTISTPVLLGRFSGDYRDHSLSFGVRWAFGGSRL